MTAPVLETRTSSCRSGRRRGPSPGLPPRRWKWTGDDLIRLGEAGFLPAEARFELLDGEIYELMPPGPLHSAVVDLVRRVIEALFPSNEAHARQQNPIRLTPRYDPQPDIAIVRGTERRYKKRFPRPVDVILVVEVMDSSVEHDRRLKLPAYAEWGIQECWLVNLPEDLVEVYREPVGKA